MKKYNQFEIFRFIGAFSVLAFHESRDTSFFKKLPVILQNGPIWVYFFFLLSGFLLSYSYNNKELNIKKFYLIRFFKFYPLYIFSLLLLFRLRTKMIYNIFLVQSWIFGKALDYNSSAWNLSALSFLLILFPFLLKFQKKYSKQFLYFVIVVNVYTYYSYFSFVRYSDNIFIHHLINYLPLFHISTFILGMELFNQIKKFKEKKYYSFFIIFYFLFLTLFIQNNSIIPYMSILVSISFIPLISLLFLDKGLFSKFLSNKIFVYLGSLSFPIYILHVPIASSYKKYIHKIDSNFHFMIVFIIIFIISNIAKYFIENKYYKFLCSKYLGKAD